MNLALIHRFFPDPTISLIGALKWYLFQVNKTTNPGFSIKLFFFSTATACTGTPLPGEPPSWGCSRRPLSHPRLQCLRITRHSKLCKTLKYPKIYSNYAFIHEPFLLGSFLFYLIFVFVCVFVIVNLCQEAVNSINFLLLCNSLGF